MRLPRRAGFTLLELVIVMAIIVSLLGIAWPALRRASARSALRQSAMEVKAALAEARDQSVRSGRDVRFEYHPNHDEYRITFFDAIEQRKGDDDLIEIAPRTGEAIASDLMSIHDPLFAGRLVAGIRFVTEINLPERGQSDAWAVDEAGDRVSDEPPDGPPRAVRFFPDGRSDSASVLLFDLEARQSIELSVRALTGSATIGDIQRHETLDQQRVPTGDLRPGEQLEKVSR